MYQVWTHLEFTITMTHCSEGPSLVEGNGSSLAVVRSGEQKNPCVCVPDLDKDERNEEYREGKKGKKIGKVGEGVRKSEWVGASHSIIYIYQGRTVLSPHVEMVRKQDGSSNRCISNYMAITQLGAGFTHF